MNPSSEPAAGVQSGVMTEAVVGRNAGLAEQWRVAEPQRSGASIKLFRKERGLTGDSFYARRKRLRKPAPCPAGK